MSAGVTCADGANNGEKEVEGGIAAGVFNIIWLVCNNVCSSGL